MIRALCLATLCAAASAAAAKCSSTPSTVFGYTSNLGTAKAATIGACCAACTANPKCVAWTSHAPSSAGGSSTAAADTRCYLHSDAKPSKAEKGATSGVIAGRKPSPSPRPRPRPTPPPPAPPPTPPTPPQLATLTTISERLFGFYRDFGDCTQVC